MRPDARRSVAKRADIWRALTTARTISVLGLAFRYFLRPPTTFPFDTHILSVLQLVINPDMDIQVPQLIKDIWYYGSFELRVPIGGSSPYTLRLSPVQVIVILIILQTVLERTVAEVQRRTGYADAAHEHID